MSFRIIFKVDEGHHPLDAVRGAIPESVFSCFKAGLLRLADDPVGLGQPAYYPVVSSSGVKDVYRLFYSYPCDWEGRRYWFRFYYYLGEDETSVVIVDAVMTVFDDPAPSSS